MSSPEAKELMGRHKKKGRLYKYKRPFFLCLITIFSSLFLSIAHQDIPRR
jgi:hypothetical protein